MTKDTGGGSSKKNKKLLNYNKEFQNLTRHKKSKQQQGKGQTESKITWSEITKKNIDEGVSTKSTRPPWSFPGWMFLSLCSVSWLCHRSSSDCFIAVQFQEFGSYHCKHCGNFNLSRWSKWKFCLKKIKKNKHQQLHYAKHCRMLSRLAMHTWNMTKSKYAF